VDNSGFAGVWEGRGGTVIYEDFKKMPTIYKTTRFVNRSDLSEKLSVHNYHGFRWAGLLAKLGPLGYS